MKKENRQLYGKRVNVEHCHDCGQDMRFEVDLDLNGNHVFACPNCGHEHCRVVKDGEITGERWDSRNGVTIYGTATLYTVTASASTGDTLGYFIGQAWMDSSGTTANY